MIGELSGLGAAAAWAIVSSVMRAVSEKTSPVVVNGLRTAFAALTLGLLMLLLGRAGSLAAMPQATVAAVVASGIVGQGIGDALFVRSMMSLGASRALPVSNIHPLLTVALAMVFLGERVTSAGAAGTLLVIGGIYLLAFPFGPLLQSSRQLSTADRGGLLQALGAAICWSVSAIVLKQALSDIDLMAANLIRLFTAAAVLLGEETLRKGRRAFAGLGRRSLGVMVMTGVLGAFSSMLYLTSLYYAGAAKASVLTSASPLFGLPLSIFFLRERINSRIVVGTLLAVLGIWLVLEG